MFKQKLFIIAIAILMILGVGSYFYARNHFFSHSPSTQQGCTTEAKACPDGTYVGRVGPNCDFAPCEPPTGTPNETQDFGAPPPTTSSATLETPPAPTTTGYALYTNTLGKYTVEYPNTWKGGTQKNNITSLAVESPDYQMSSGYPYLELGASLSVNVSTASASDVKNYVESNALLKNIAKEITDTTMDGLPAIQYSFSYEGVIATSTVTVKDGIAYEIRYRYADDQTKTKYLDLYQHMVSTLTLTD